MTVPSDNDEGRPTSAANNASNRGFVQKPATTRGNSTSNDNGSSSFSHNGSSSGRAIHQSQTWLANDMIRHLSERMNRKCLFHQRQASCHAAPGTSNSSSSIHPDQGNDIQRTCSSGTCGGDADYFAMRLPNQAHIPEGNMGRMPRISDDQDIPPRDRMAPAVIATGTSSEPQDNSCNGRCHSRVIF